MDAKDKKIKELEAELKKLKKKDPRVRKFEMVLRVIEGERVVTEESRQVLLRGEEWDSVNLEGSLEDHMLEAIAGVVRRLPIESMIRTLIHRARIKPVR